MMRTGLTVAALALLAVTIVGQSPMGPFFDVVSIRRNTTVGPGGFPVSRPPVELPNGGVRLTGVRASNLLFRAWRTAAPSTTGWWT